MYTTKKVLFVQRMIAQCGAHPATQRALGGFVRGEDEQPGVVNNIKEQKLSACSHVTMIWNPPATSILVSLSN